MDFFVLMGLQFHENLGKTKRDTEFKICDSQSEKENKSERGMPRLPKTMKDVVSCDKLRGFANRN